MVITGHKSSQVTSHRSSVPQESSKAEGGAFIGVIRAAVVAQEAHGSVSFVSDDEVGAVVKAGITVAAQAELVLVTLLIAFFDGKFDARVVLHGRHIGGDGSGSSSSSPVGRSSSRHLFVGVVVWWELSSVTKKKKYFNFIQPSQ
jgi:hypothetical protein